MKKFYSFLAAAALAFSFTACEDVPAPYGIGEESGDITPTPGEDGVIFEAEFATDFGGFTNFTTSGEGGWKIDFKTAKASGYDSENKVNVAGVYYLVSPEISLAGQTEAHLTYEYIQAYSTRFADGDKVMISSEVFDPAKADQNWTELAVKFAEPNKTTEGKIDWKSFHNMDIQIPAEYMGKTIRIAFYHACDEKGSTTMEIKNLKLMSGKAEGGEVTPDPEPQPEGVRELPYSESFSSSLGGFKSVTASGKGEWIIDFSTAKMSNHVGGKEGYDEAGTVLLVSPEINLANQQDVKVSYEYILRYDKGQENQQLMINTAYDEANPDNGWQLLNGTHTEGRDWATFEKAEIAVPAEYTGKKIRLAFRYVSTDTGSSTWEIKNFNIAAGSAVTPPAGNAQQLPYTEAFSSSLGGFKSYTANGQGEWIIDFSTAKMTNHSGGNPGTDVAGTVLLVSPEISLEGQTEAHVAYEYILRYDKGQENQQLMISTAFDEANPDNGWQLLNGTHTEGADWKTFATGDFAIPAEYMGKTIRLAFRYVSNDTGSSTWEVKNFSIAAGKPGEGGGEVGPEPGAGDEGDVNALNGDFECWVGGQPNNWNGEANNATLEQSTDAKSGKYSVVVKGENGRNKRLAYKALDLKAGTYTIKAFFKSETGATARFGYVTVPAASGNDYKYGDYINNIPNTWTEYSNTIEIPADGKYSFLIMNGKKPGTDFLVDDITVTAADGTVIIK